MARCLHIALCAAAAVGALSVSAHPQQPAARTPGCALRIHVDGFRNAHGNLGTVVFSSPDGWPEDLSKAFRHGPAPIDPATRTAAAEWADLPPGDYGVAAIHDENSNRRLDRNFLGIPREGFGFANNPHVGLSAPAFREALVHVSCGKPEAGPEAKTEITIHLIYK